MSDQATPAITTNPLGETHEARFLDDLKAMDVAGRNKGVIRLHLSRLAPENRDRQNLLNAETVFDELTRTRSAWLYRLRSSDLMVVYERHEEDTAERAVLKLLKLWERDPLMQKSKGDARKNRLSSWFDMAQDYDKLLTFAMRQTATTDRSVRKSLPELIAERELQRSNTERGAPLMPLELGSNWALPCSRAAISTVSPEDAKEGDKRALKWCRRMLHAFAILQSYFMDMLLEPVVTLRSRT